MYINYINKNIFSLYSKWLCRLKIQLWTPLSHGNGLLSSELFPHSVSIQNGGLTSVTAGAVTCYRIGRIERYRVLQRQIEIVLKNKSRSKKLKKNKQTLLNFIPQLKQQSIKK